jgi:polyphosphate:AMP phosphotransferase
MFEAAELGQKVSKHDFDAALPDLRAELLAAQRALKSTRSPLVIIISGVQGAGKGEVVNRLNEWLDTRDIQTHAFWDSTDEERQRPYYWRYWRSLPPRGSTGILFGGWYSAELIDKGYSAKSLNVIDTDLNRIVDYERMLAADGALILKFWYHLPRRVQRPRLQALTDDEHSYWKMAAQYAGRKKEYARFCSLAERIIRATDIGLAPWHVIEATDRRFRDLTTAQILLQALKRRLQQEAEGARAQGSEAAFEPLAVADQATVLDRVDLSQSPDKDVNKRRLAAYQARLNQQAWEAYRTRRACVMVFEGWDAGGKGGAIRRLTAAIDARIMRAISVAAPTDEERAHHYLWRFWRHIPRDGYFTIFDRSWYGRVLVERIEGFATDAEWQRAYREINNFEEMLTEHGIVVFKFWLHIDKDEQLRRFQEREQIPYKQHKITEEDWRNREKWDDYERAVNEMVVRTSTEYAPWILVAGNDKRLARVEVIKNVCQRLDKALRGN